MVFLKGIYPPGYEPFQYLDICSNKIEGGGRPFEIGEVVPLLVGRGMQFPMVWLTLPWPPPSVIGINQKWIEAVNGDRLSDKLPEPLRSILRVSNRVTPVPTVEVWLGKSPVLRARQEDKLSGRVDFIDLRPLGLAISGSADELVVGTNVFKGNRISDGVMIKL
jgi:hypothetical protein